MSARMAYIAVEPCGCVTAATVDEPQYAKDNAKEISKWMRGGRTIERVTTDEARERLTFDWPCEHVQSAAHAESEQMKLSVDH